MTLMKNKKCIFSAFFAAFIFTSCSTLKEPEEIYELPDYTEEDAKNAEIARIEDLLEKNPVQAMWRATLIQDELTLKKTSDKVLAEFNKDLNAKNYFSAKKLYKSLRTVSPDFVSGLSVDEKELERLCNENVPGLSKKNVTGKQKVSSYINGTVTVWVDKGVKVERGVGYADRVIGSGFFISSDGYIVTNHHVISDLVDKRSEGYSRLFIKLAEDSDTRIPAKVIGWDSDIDLALLKAEVTAPYVFNLGSSEDLDVGDKIYAIGSPVGLERTLTSGIVSAVDRKLFSLGSVMQIDAAVNSGNSGGPCIDENGNVQAIVFAGMLQYEGLNFAIPVEYLKAELPALYAGVASGEAVAEKVEHSWLCAFGHTKKDLGKDSGLEMQYIMPGGSACRAGLKAGDVITEFDGQKISSLEDMQNALLKNPAKSIVSLKYVDGEGAEKSCSIYLALRPENPGYLVYNSDIWANSFLPIYGMKLSQEGGSKKYSVESVIRGSVADESGFSENDFIQIRNIQFNKEKSVISSEIYAKNRKKGYLDVGLMLSAMLDSPYYF